MDSSPPSNPSPQEEKIEITPEILERASVNLQIKSRDPYWYEEFLRQLNEAMQEKMSRGMAVGHILDGVEKASSSSPAALSGAIAITQYLPRVTANLIGPVSKCCDLSATLLREKIFVEMAALAYGWYLRHMLGRKLGRQMGKYINDYRKEWEQFFNSMKGSAILEVLRDKAVFEELTADEPDRESATGEKRKMENFLDGATKNIHELPLTQALKEQMLHEIITGVFGTVFISYLKITADVYNAEISIEDGRLIIVTQEGDVRNKEEMAGIINMSQETISKNILKNPLVNLEKLKKYLARHFFDKGHRIVQMVNHKSPKAHQIGRAVEAAMLLTGEFLESCTPETLIHYTSAELYSKLMEALPDPDATTETEQIRQKITAKAETATKTEETDAGKSAAESQGDKIGTPETRVEITPELVERASINLQIRLRDGDWHQAFLQVLNEKMQGPLPSDNSFKIIARGLEKIATTSPALFEFVNTVNAYLPSLPAKVSGPIWKCCDFSGMIKRERGYVSMAAMVYKWYMRHALGRQNGKRMEKYIEEYKKEKEKNIAFLTGSAVLEYLRGTPFFDELVAEAPDKESAEEEKRKYDYLLKTATVNIHNLPITKAEKEELLQEIINNVELIVHNSFLEVVSGIMKAGVVVIDGRPQMVATNEDAEIIAQVSEELNMDRDKNNAEMLDGPVLNLGIIKTRLGKVFFEKSVNVEKILRKRGHQFQPLARTFQASMLLTSEYLDEISPETLLHYTSPDFFNKLMASLPDPAPAAETEAVKENVAVQISSTPEPIPGAPLSADSSAPLTPPSNESVEITPEILDRAFINLQIKGRNQRWDIMAFQDALFAGMMREPRAMSLQKRLIDKVEQTAMELNQSIPQSEDVEYLFSSIFSKLYIYRPRCMDAPGIIQLERTQKQMHTLVLRWVLRQKMGKIGMKKMEKHLDDYEKAWDGFLKAADKARILDWIRGTALHNELVSANPDPDAAAMERRKFDILLRNARQNLNDIPVPEALRLQFARDIVSAIHGLFFKSFLHAICEIKSIEVSYSSDQFQLKINDPQDENFEITMDFELEQGTEKIKDIIKRNEPCGFERIKSVMIAHYHVIRASVEGMHKQYPQQKYRFLSLAVSDALDLTIKQLTATDADLIVHLSSLSTYKEIIEAIPDPALEIENGASAPQTVTPAESKNNAEELSEKEKLYLQEALGDFYHLDPESSEYSADELLSAIKEKGFLEEWTEDLNHLYRSSGTAITADTVEKYLRENLAQKTEMEESRPPENCFAIPSSLAQRIESAVDDWNKIRDARMERRKERREREPAEEKRHYSPRRQFSDKIGDCISALLSDSVHLRVSSLTQLESLAQTLELINGQLIDRADASGWQYKSVSVKIKPVILALSANAGEAEPDENILKLRDLLEEQKKAVAGKETELEAVAGGAKKKEIHEAKISDYQEERQLVEGSAARLQKLRAETRKTLAEYFSRVAADLSSRDGDLRDRLVELEEETAVAVEKAHKEIEHLGNLIMQAEEQLRMAGEKGVETAVIEKEIERQKTEMSALQNDLLALYNEYADLYF